ncbi:MAG: hypothetical protein E7283_09990 [Lachnospiraceae bacterium]|nr:hypothetical protein [Lachnospiraceae bacterium]
MRKMFKKLFPLGLDIPGQMAIIVVFLTIAFMIEYLTFVFNYETDVIKNCYKDCIDIYRLKENYQMPEFTPMLRNCFDIGWYYIALLGLVIYNYCYHYKTYKSIYLMRRLENVWEIHRRCWGIIIIGGLCVVLWMFVLWLVCYGYYCIAPLPETFEWRYIT